MIATFLYETTMNDEGYFELNKDHPIVIEIINRKKIGERDLQCCGYMKNNKMILSIFDENYLTIRINYLENGRRFLQQAI